MSNKIEKSFLTMFGIGYFTKIPGTLASLVTCFIFYFVWLLCPMIWLLPRIQIILLFYLIFFIYIFFYSSYAINKYFKKKDAKEIVIDEFLGQSMPLMSWYYLIYNSKHVGLWGLTGGVGGSGIISWILISFLLFRFFDILKPFPINLIDEKIKNGFGVMFDDVVAGIFSTIALYVIVVIIMNLKFNV